MSVSEAVNGVYPPGRRSKSHCNCGHYHHGFQAISFRPGYHYADECRVDPKPEGSVAAYTLSFDELEWKEFSPPPATCRCDIKDLLSTDHNKDCPEKRR